MIVPSKFPCISIIRLLRSALRFRELMHPDPHLRPSGSRWLWGRCASAAIEGYCPIQMDASLARQLLLMTMGKKTALLVVSLMVIT